MPCVPIAEHKTHGAGVHSWMGGVRKLRDGKAGITKREADFSLLQLGDWKHDMEMRIDPAAIPASAGGKPKLNRFYEVPPKPKYQPPTDPITHFEYETAHMPGTRGDHYRANPTKRSGYSSSAAKTQLSLTHDPSLSAQLKEVDMKPEITTGADGIRYYNIWGKEDLRMAATRDTIQCELMPKKKHIEYNDWMEMPYCIRDFMADKKRPHEHCHWGSSRIWESMRDESYNAVMHQLKESPCQELKDCWAAKMLHPQNKEAKEAAYVRHKTARLALPSYDAKITKFHTLPQRRHKSQEQRIMKEQPPYGVDRRTSVTGKEDWGLEEEWVMRGGVWMTKSDAEHCLVMQRSMKAKTGEKCDYQKLLDEMHNAKVDAKAQASRAYAADRQAVEAKGSQRRSKSEEPGARSSGSRSLPGPPSAAPAMSARTLPAPPSARGSGTSFNSLPPPPLATSARMDRPNTARPRLRTGSASPASSWGGRSAMSEVSISNASLRQAASDKRRQASRDGRRGSS